MKSEIYRRDSQGDPELAQAEKEFLALAEDEKSLVYHAAMEFYDRGTAFQNLAGTHVENHRKVLAAMRLKAEAYRRLAAANDSDLQRTAANDSDLQRTAANDSELQRTAASGSE